MAKKKTSRAAAPGDEDSAASQAVEDILTIATEEFALKGFSGARVDEIAERTQTSKRMIYYYFGGKEALYRAVLAKVYGDIRNREAEIHATELSPVEAIRRLIELTFDYDESHVPFIRLVMNENIHRAKYLAKLPNSRNVNASVIRTLHEIMKRGVEERVFTNELDPLDLHLFISAFCFFRVSNQHTLKVLFGRDLAEPEMRKRHKKLLIDAVFNLLGVSARHRR